MVYIQPDGGSPPFCLRMLDPTDFSDKPGQVLTHHLYNIDPL